MKRLLRYVLVGKIPTKLSMVTENFLNLYFIKTLHNTEEPDCKSDKIFDHCFCLF